VAEETRKRKADHIRICLNEKAQARKATTGFEDIHLVHKALPEINKKKIENAKGKTLSLQELLKNNPDGKQVRILG